jgi:Lipocalin-like domain
MNRHITLALGTMALLGLGVALPGAAVAQQKPIKEQIVGTWTFVSALDIYPDGRKNDRWGTNPKGVFMFDGNGRFAQFITRSDLPKVSAGTADKGTAEENKAIVSGLVASFGTYTVNEAEKMVITRVEGGGLFRILSGPIRSE